MPQTVCRGLHTLGFLCTPLSPMRSVSLCTPRTPLTILVTCVSLPDSPMRISPCADLSPLSHVLTLPLSPHALTHCSPLSPHLLTCLLTSLLLPHVFASLLTLHAHPCVNPSHPLSPLLPHALPSSLARAFTPPILCAHVSPRIYVCPKSGLGL